VARTNGLQRQRADWREPAIAQRMRREDGTETSEGEAVPTKGAGGVTRCRTGQTGRGIR